MIAAAPDQWWAIMIRLAASTGLRRAELWNLQWRDIDLDARELTVSRKLAGRFTVGNETFPVLPWETKTHTARTIPLPDATVAALRRFRLASGGSPYVFLSLPLLRKVGRRMEAGMWKASTRLLPSFNYWFTRIQRDARALLAAERRARVDDVDWPPGRFHDLRATYATETAPEVDLLTLCKWLGHSTPTTTQRFYHRTKQSTADHARAAMDARYGPVPYAQVTRDAPPPPPPPDGLSENGVLATIGA